MSNLLKTLLLPLVVALAASVAAYGNVTVSARLDSAVLLMGKQTALHIEVLQNADVDGSFLNERADTLTQFVEVVGRTDGDTVDLGNNRIQIIRDWILQSFDSGLYVLPPMQYINIAAIKSIIAGIIIFFVISFSSPLQLFWYLPNMQLYDRCAFPLHHKSA